MIGGVDVFHEHLIVLFFFFKFTSIDLNHFKIYVETILLNILLTFFLFEIVIFCQFIHILLISGYMEKNINLYCLREMLLNFLKF